MMVRSRDRKNVRNVKVIGGEECVKQHKLVVSELLIEVKEVKKKK